MPPLMSLAIWWRRKTLVTKQTIVWFFSSMWPLVYCKVGWNPKAHPAVWALIRFFTSVCSFVDLEVWSSWEVLVTFYTFEDLFLYVQRHHSTLVNLNSLDVSPSWSDLFLLHTNTTLHESFTLFWDLTPVETKLNVRKTSIFMCSPFHKCCTQKNTPQLWVWLVMVHKWYSLHSSLVISHGCLPYTVYIKQWLPNQLSNTLLFDFPGQTSHVVLWKVQT